MKRLAFYGVESVPVEHPDGMYVLYREAEAAVTEARERVAELKDDNALLLAQLGAKGDHGLELVRLWIRIYDLRTRPRHVQYLDDTPNEGDAQFVSEKLEDQANTIASLKAALAEAQGALGVEEKKTDAIRTIVEPFTLERAKVVDMTKDAIATLQRERDEAREKLRVAADDAEFQAARVYALEQRVHDLERHLTT